MMSCLKHWEQIGIGKPVSNVLLADSNGWAVGKFDKKTKQYLRLKYNGEYEILDFTPTHYQPCPDIPSMQEKTND